MHFLCAPLGDFDGDRLIELLTKANFTQEKKNQLRLYLMFKLIKAYYMMNDCGFRHADGKPSNVIFTREDACMVNDPNHIDRLLSEANVPEHQKRIIIQLLTINVDERMKIEDAWTIVKDNESEIDMSMIEEIKDKLSTVLEKYKKKVEETREAVTKSSQILAGMTGDKNQPLQGVSALQLGRKAKAVLWQTKEKNKESNHVDNNNDAVVTGQSHLAVHHDLSKSIRLKRPGKDK